jgi:uncharacterized membrane protein HdeD (DUF308 family)
MLILWIGDWRAVALRGLAALAFGIFILAWPHLTLWALVGLFGAFALVDGLFTLAAVISGALLLMVAYRVRKLQHDGDGRVPGMRLATA